MTKNTVLYFKSLNPENKNSICIIERGTNILDKIGDTRLFEGHEEEWELYKIEEVG